MVYSPSLLYLGIEVSHAFPTNKNMKICSLLVYYHSSVPAEHYTNLGHNLGSLRRLRSTGCASNGNDGRGHSTGGRGPSSGGGFVDKRTKVHCHRIGCRGIGTYISGHVRLHEDRGEGHDEN